VRVTITSDAKVADFTSFDCGVEQLRADRDQAVEEVVVQHLEAAAVRAQRVGQPMLGDQEINEQVDPLMQCRERGTGAGQQSRAGLGAGLNLMTVDRDDEIRPGREMPVDRRDPDASTGRDLLVAGDQDASAQLTLRGPEWHTDPYYLSPGPKSLLILFGAEHGFGGIAGYDAAETTDESPERVAAVGRLTCAYLRTELYPGDCGWPAARDALAAGPTPPGRVESR